MMMITWLYKSGICLLPKNLASRLAGYVALITYPKFFVNFLILIFIKKYKVDIEESRKTVKEFVNFQDFFSRGLKNNRRPIKTGAGEVVSPCDGFWGQSGDICDGNALQVKGKEYSVASLLESDKDAAVLVEEHCE